MSPILTGIIASGISGNLTPPWSPEGAFDALATVTVPSGGVSSVSFTGIPNGYKHLQVRAMHLYSGSGANLVCSYNSGSFNNVISHFTYGNGTVASDKDSSTAIISFQSGASTSAFCVAVYDFLDYSNPNKTRTMRGLVGQDVNTAGLVAIESALATNTAPINALTFSYASGATLQQHTQFALYGVK